ncbi:hypothetical protein TorRG33x02_048140 [Trema orientale]|uniref:Protein FLX-like n=1 Tax=Trema orientale TaxID=63057 RepID=A0A2P5FN92_TREOI|nr:hypothetical protein TorRG33x02_048140 [Trema orientale]
MEARGRIPTGPEMIRHGTLSGLGPVAGRRNLEPIHHPELLETKIAAQAAEIKQLAGDNQRLASSHVVLREELVTAQQEVQRLKAHIRSLQTEGDVQMRVLVERIKRMDADIRAGEGVKNDLQQARKDAQNLVIARQELNLRLQEATQELQKVRDEIKSLPDLHAELDSLRREHQRLRATFEYEKGLNIDQVDQLQAMEKTLISMAREVEKLRIQVSNAEKKANAPNPYASGYMNPEFRCLPPVQGAVPYIDSHARPHAQMGVWPEGEGMNPYGSSRVMPPGGSAFPATRIATTVPSTGVAAVPTGGGVFVPTGADAAVHVSGVASASTSGGDATCGGA